MTPSAGEREGTGSGARVALALGSNLGDRLGHLARAVEGLAPVLRDLALSSVYESDAVGYEDQPAFLNAVVVGRTDLGPDEILARGHALEEAAGRRRSFPNAPRTLDVDLVLYGRDTRGPPAPEGSRAGPGAPPGRAPLRIPHPRFRERSFVLAPLAEVLPDGVDPLTGRTVLELWTEARHVLPPVRIVAPPTALRRSTP